LHSQDCRIGDKLKKGYVEPQRQMTSQTSTIDFGNSVSQSRAELPLQNKLSRDRSNNQQLSISPSASRLNRQRTFSSSKPLPRDSNLGGAGHSKKLERELSDADAFLKPPGPDMRSVNSLNSKGAFSQKIQPNGSIERDQRIFDVYMKAPYKLMDTGHQKRLQNRKIFKLNLSTSPAKDRITLEGTMRESAGYDIGSKRNSINLSNHNLYKTSILTNSSHHR